VDWFEYDALPIAVEDGPIPGSGPFTLTVTTVGSGQVLKSPDQATYNCTEVVTLTAVADVGWNFTGWTGDASGVGNPITVPMLEDRVITATFMQDNNPPVISNVNVIAGQTAATVTWTTDEPATSQVAYGLNGSYGQLEEDLTLKQNHSVVLQGLTAETLYHFMVCSSDVGGNTGCTEDDTFSTTPPSGLVTDDFNHCEGLISPWTFVDLMGDGAYSVTGVGTDDAWLNLAVPAGANHDPYGTQMPARIVQPVNDVDMQFTVKLESALTQAIQLQGVMVEQDPLNWIRYDLYSDGYNVYAYVATTVAGTTTMQAKLLLTGAVPSYLRVTRVTDNWTMSWSPDPVGVGWTDVAAFDHPVVAMQVGLYGGNNDNGGVAAPAHVASFDYFEDSYTPLVVEDGSFPGSGPFTLTTNTVGDGTILVDPLQPTYSCTDVVTLTALAMAGWDFAGWDGDLTGSANPEVLSMTADRSVTATFIQDISPPVISNIQVIESATGATITWTTDEPATSRVDYGLSSGYGSFQEDLGFVLSHSIVLSALTSETTYHFQITSADDGGMTASTSDDIFTTRPIWTGMSDDFNDCGTLSGLWSVMLLIRWTDRGPPMRAFQL